MIDISDVIKTLAAQRKAYHSEADFQHAFAWEIHRRSPDTSIRLERPMSVEGEPLYLDLLFQQPNRAIAVELKYKTKKFLGKLDGEDFHLKDQQALDSGRFDFIKDICRLEKMALNVGNCEGYAILLTNVSAYWKPSPPKDTNDAAFHLYEGRILHGPLKWALKTRREQRMDGAIFTSTVSINSTGATIRSRTLIAIFISDISPFMCPNAFDKL